MDGQLEWNEKKSFIFYQWTKTAAYLLSLFSRELTDESRVMVVVVVVVCYSSLLLLESDSAICPSVRASKENKKTRRNKFKPLSSIL